MRGENYYTVSRIPHFTMDIKYRPPNGDYTANIIYTRIDDDTSLYTWFPNNVREVKVAAVGISIRLSREEYLSPTILFLRLPGRATVGKGNVEKWQEQTKIAAFCINSINLTNEGDFRRKTIRNNSKDLPKGEVISKEEDSPLDAYNKEIRWVCTNTEVPAQHTPPGVDIRKNTRKDYH